MQANSCLAKLKAGLQGDLMGQRDTLQPSAGSLCSRNPRKTQSRSSNWFYGIRPWISPKFRRPIHSGRHSTHPMLMDMRGWTIQPRQ